MRWYHWWRFSLRGTEELCILTPFFLLIVSYGAPDYLRAVYWWGFEFGWKRRKNIQFADLLFEKWYRFEFRHYTKRQWYEAGKSLPL